MHNKFVVAFTLLITFIRLTYTFKLEHELSNAISTVLEGTKKGNIDANFVLKVLEKNAIGILCNAKYKLNPGDIFYQSQQEFCDNTKKGMKKEEAVERVKEIIETTKIDKKMFDQNAIQKKIEKDEMLSDENRGKLVKLTNFAQNGFEFIVDLIEVQKSEQFFGQITPRFAHIRRRKRTSLIRKRVGDKKGEETGEKESEGESEEKGEKKGEETGEKESEEKGEKKGEETGEKESEHWGDDGKRVVGKIDSFISLLFGLVIMSIIACNAYLINIMFKNAHTNNYTSDVPGIDEYLDVYCLAIYAFMIPAMLFAHFYLHCQ